MTRYDECRALNDLTALPIEHVAACRFVGHVILPMTIGAISQNDPSANDKVEHRSANNLTMPQEAIVSLLRRLVRPPLFEIDVSRARPLSDTKWLEASFETM